MSNKTMHLVVSTNNVGSECEIDLDITEEEWNDFTEMAQQELIRESLPDVVDIYVMPKQTKRN